MYFKINDKQSTVKDSKNQNEVSTFAQYILRTPTNQNEVSTFPQYIKDTKKSK